MENGRKNKHPLDKLDDIWLLIKESGSSYTQNCVLRHLLGDIQEGLSISVVHRSPSGEIDIEPDYLYRALSKGISKLVTKADKNGIKESEMLLEKDEIIRRLRNKLQISESSSSHNDSKASMFFEQMRVLEQKLQESEALNSKYNSILSELKQENKLLSNKVNTLSQSYEELSDTSNDIAHYQHRLREEISEKEHLMGKLKTLEEESEAYKQAEHFILPDLQKLSYCRKHMGKSISLEPSQIENVVRGYLHGDSNYRISKDLGISHTSIKKILSCDYSTVPSLEKILSALHSVNGNWGTDKKELLNELIQLYTVRLEDAKERSKLNFNEIEKSMSSLFDYSKSRTI